MNILKRPNKISDIIFGVIVLSFVLPITLISAYIMNSIFLGIISVYFLVVGVIRILIAADILDWRKFDIRYIWENHGEEKE